MGGAVGMHAGLRSRAGGAGVQGGAQRRVARGHVGEGVGEGVGVERAAEATGARDEVGGGQRRVAPQVGLLVA
jgi:hypothetical protein